MPFKLSIEFKFFYHTWNISMHVSCINMIYLSADWIMSAKVFLTVIAMNILDLTTLHCDALSWDNKDKCLKTNEHWEQFNSVLCWLAVLESAVFLSNIPVTILLSL